MSIRQMEFGWFLDAEVHGVIKGDLWCRVSMLTGRRGKIRGVRVVHVV